MTLDAFVQSMDNAFAQPMHSQHRTVLNEYGLNDYTVQNRHRRGGMTKAEFQSEVGIYIGIPLIIFLSIMPISFHKATDRALGKGYFILGVTALAYICLFVALYKAWNYIEHIDLFPKDSRKVLVIFMKLILLFILGSILFACNSLQVQERKPAPGIGLMLAVFLIFLILFRNDLLFAPIKDVNASFYAIGLLSIIISLIFAVAPASTGSEIAAWCIGLVLFLGLSFAEKKNLMRNADLLQNEDDALQPQPRKNDN